LNPARLGTFPTATAQEDKDEKQSEQAKRLPLSHEHPSKNKKSIVLPDANPLVRDKYLKPRLQGKKFFRSTPFRRRLCAATLCGFAAVESLTTGAPCTAAMRGACIARS
jgi:hypothetical protein